MKSYQQLGSVFSIGQGGTAVVIYEVKSIINKTNIRRFP